MPDRWKHSQPIVYEDNSDCGQGTVDIPDFGSTVISGIFPDKPESINELEIDLLQDLCGMLTGHELSNTEFGYGGKGMVDRWCRWCNKLIQIPKDESYFPEKVPGILKSLGLDPDKWAN